MEGDNLGTLSTNKSVANVCALNKKGVTIAQVHHVAFVYPSDSDVDVPSDQANFMLTDDVSSEVQSIFQHIL